MIPAGWHPYIFDYWDYYDLLEQAYKEQEPPFIISDTSDTSLNDKIKITESGVLCIVPEDLATNTPAIIEYKIRLWDLMSPSIWDWEPAGADSVEIYETLEEIKTREEARKLFCYLELLHDFDAMMIMSPKPGGYITKARCQKSGSAKYPFSISLY